MLRQHPFRQGSRVWQGLNIGEAITAVELADKLIEALRGDLTRRLLRSFRNLSFRPAAKRAPGRAEQQHVTMPPISQSLGGPQVRGELNPNDRRLALGAGFFALNIGRGPLWTSLIPLLDNLLPHRM